VRPISNIKGKQYKRLKVQVATWNILSEVSSEGPGPR
jgi:hypothetical protein